MLHILEKVKGKTEDITKTTTLIKNKSTFDTCICFYRYLYSNDMEFIAEDAFANLENLQLL